MASLPPTTTAGAIEGGCVFLDAATLRSLLTPSALIPHLRSSVPSLSSAVRAPPRQSFSLDPSSSSSLLLMPSWSSDPSLPFIGVKIVTSFPHNSVLRLPGVHAAYLLFRSSTGAPLASLDGTALTLLRTSAVSALAAAFLARDDSRVLVMAGAGALAPYLIAAQRFVRPSLNRIIIWNRTPDKARILARDLQEKERRENSGVIFEHAECLDEVVGLGDVVSCATSSENPIVKGKKLKPGAHLDLAGSFTPAMRECDDEALARGRVFVDFEVALEEAGELAGAFQRGVMAPEDVAGTLAELVGGAKVGRRSPEELTVFKSVGTAVVDLLAAQLAYDTYLQGRIYPSFVFCSYVWYFDVYLGYFNSHYFFLALGIGSSVMVFLPKFSVYLSFHFSSFPMIFELLIEKMRIAVLLPVHW
ncbi:protein SAR DEFICIENT 4 [Cocos nucifera]|uniref:Protein SAR DEFICIENT 4 n=1 Tax=Cocos nucifera TaxID=13894 RepID=A0A8K0ILF9_COCNU|nr:protein SAR DEFICIENT 4 [Cocos nucifera]